MDGGGAVDRDEFLELAIDALLTLDADKTLLGSIYSYFNSGPKLNIGVARQSKTRVGLWFDAGDAANNDLADVDYSALGPIDIINGFEVMCRAGDMNINVQDRQVRGVPSDSWGTPQCLPRAFVGRRMSGH